MELRRLGFPELVRYGCRLVPEHFWDSASETAAQRMLRGRSPLLDQLLFTHSSRTRYLAETAKAVDLFIAPSKFVRDVYEDLGFPRRSIMICPHGVRGDRFVNQTKSKSGKVRFAYIGSVDEHKGLHVLVRAFNRLVGKDAELRIWGAIPNPRYLRELRLLNENPNLQFMDYCDDAASILLGTDVLVVPSIMYESFSVATREAFLTGTPVIASSIGALPEVVAEGVNGFMFPPSDWVRLAICMLRFVEDPELVSRMQKNMPVVKTIDEHVQELECIYDEVIQSSNAGKLDQLSPGI
jgi:glycosyltransferase involved in cell wall biosynthesis